jgi:hypothetical protein
VCWLETISFILATFNCPTLLEPRSNIIFLSGSNSWVKNSELKRLGVGSSDEALVLNNKVNVKKNEIITHKVILPFIIFLLR